MGMRYTCFLAMVTMLVLNLLEVKPRLILANASYFPAAALKMALSHSI